MRNLFAATVILVGAITQLRCTTTPPAQSPATLTSGTDEPGCALGVAGARASLAEAPNGGVAITVLAQPNVDEIRVRARDAASMFGSDARKGLGHEGRHGTGGKHGLGAMQLPPLRGAVEDVAGGARIELTPVDAADRETLRKRVEDRVAAMNANCE